MLLAGTGLSVSVFLADGRFGAKPTALARQFKRMHRTLLALRPRVGRVVQRDIERQLQRARPPPDVRERLDELLGRTRRMLQQPPSSTAMGSQARLAMPAMPCCAAQGIAVA